MAKASKGGSEPHGKSASRKPKPVKPEDVRVTLRKGGKGSEAVFPGPRQTAALLKQRRTQQAQTDPSDREPEGR